jgi:glycosyltransferase involved in cell wall biosynthesis
LKIFLDKRKGKKHIVIQRMEPYWNLWGHEIQWEPEGADVQLCIVKRQTTTDLPFVLRLDGIYYGHDSPKNRELSNSHHHANAIIYQSRWCWEQAEKFLKPRQSDAWSAIIYNGIEPISEAALIPEPKKDQINIMTTSRWRRWKRLREITKVFKMAQRHSGLPINLHVFGNTYDFKRPKNPHIHFYGKIDRAELWNFYLRGHVFVHLSKNDWCPNAVIEAFSFGLPLLASSAGAGTLELLDLVGKEAGMIIEEGEPSCENDPYDREWNSMTKEQIEQGAEKLIALCKSNWRPKLPKELHVETMARKYINIMEKVG